MRNDQPLKQLLIDTRGWWDHPGTRPAVRENFEKVIRCGTRALGAEVFASATEEKLVFHTCKSRACPSCGYRQILLWLREKWVTLPDVPYAGIVFTMPNTLWPVFKQNRHLLHDLPSIGAAVVELWVKETHDVRPLIMVVPHTFGGYLNFNCHLHILVSDGGLNESQGQWLAGLNFDQDALMCLWRDAVLSYLRMALKADVLRSNRSVKFLESVFTSEAARPKWIIYISESMSKRHFLSYAARYAKRLPIAQRWLSRVSAGEVEFFAKDTRKHQRVKTKQSSTRFAAALAEHVPDRYKHNMRYYGLLAPASIRKTSAALCALLGKPKQRRPPRLSWRDSLLKYFGVDPLVDSQGQPMRWTGRLGSVAL